MNTTVVLGIGNEFRRDDGVGIAVAEQLAGLGLAGVRVVTATAEPGAILDAWRDADLAVVVDAAAGEATSPGRIRRWTPGAPAPHVVVSSHALDISQVYALGEALAQLPHRLVVLSVDVADAGYGAGLTPAVAAAVPRAVEVVLTEIRRGRGSDLRSAECLD